MAKLLAPTACVGGRAGSFPCHNIDYLAQVQLAEIPTQPTSASNLWGFVDLDDNREYAVLGHRNGTAVVRRDGARQRRCWSATFPGNASLWREVKVYQVPIRPAARIAPTPTSAPRRRAAACRSSI